MSKKLTFVDEKLYEDCKDMQKLSVLFLILIPSGETEISSHFQSGPQLKYDNLKSWSDTWCPHAFCYSFQSLRASVWDYVWTMHSVYTWSLLKESIIPYYCSKSTEWVNLLTTNVSHHIETSHLIFNANQLTGFYMMGNIGR